MCWGTLKSMKIKLHTIVVIFMQFYNPLSVAAADAKGGGS